MSVHYFKRYRMRFDLADLSDSGTPLPYGYHLFGWDPALVEGHAKAKYESFRHELDANVFPCLGDAEGCQRLMREIVNRKGFVPQATWLIAYRPANARRTVYCGTVQGIRDHDEIGSIQNLGVAPNHRGLGLGTILLSQSLHGLNRF